MRILTEIINFYAINFFCELFDEDIKSSLEV